VRVLVTGFGPFGEVVSNPTERAARALGGLVLPTSFARAPVLLADALPGYDVVLMLGVAESSETFRVETRGLNRDDARIADVDGERPVGPIVAGGPEALPVTVDVARMREAIAGVGLPSALSESAGAYVCNRVLFSTLHRLQAGDVRAGFLHVPADVHTHAQPRTERRFEAIVAAVQAALRAL
jgi:pyroglutamyl-peptidase